MKQQVKRKTLSGAWAEFKFDHKALSFFIKNFSDGDIFVSFENGDKEEESFKIRSGVGEEVAISYGGTNRSIHNTDTIYVKGTGEVEVQELDWRD